MFRRIFACFLISVGAASAQQSNIAGEELNMKKFYPQDSSLTQRNKLNYNFEDIQLKTFLVTGTSKMEGDADMNGWDLKQADTVDAALVEAQFLNVASNVVISGNLLVLGDTTSGATVTNISNISGTDLTVEQDLYVWGSTTISNNLYVVGESEFFDLWVKNSALIGTNQPTALNTNSFLHIHSSEDRNQAVVYTSEEGQADWQIVTRVGSNYWELVAVDNLVTPTETTELLKFQYINNDWVSSVGAGGPGGGPGLSAPTVGFFSWKVSSDGDEIFGDIDNLFEDLTPTTVGPISSFSSPAFRTGYLASNIVDGAYAVDVPGGTLVDYIVGSDAAVTAFTLEDEFNYAQQGSLALYATNGTTVLGSFNLGNAFNPANAAGPQQYTPATVARLSILDVAPVGGIRHLQQGSASFDVSTLLAVGHNDFPVARTGMNYPDQTPDLRVYFDDRAGIPDPVIDLTPGNLTIDIDEPPTPYEYISGVRFFTINHFVALSYIADNMFNRTYVDPPVTYSSDITGDGGVLINSPAVQGFFTSKPVPNFDDQFVVNGALVPIEQGEAAYTNVVMTLTPRNPHGDYVPVVYDMINTVGHTFGVDANRRSTAGAEYFSDEHWRLPLTHPTDTSPVLTNVWDSAAALVDGNAQLYPKDGEMYLVYPETDFTVGDWSPIQNTLNYSGFTGTQAYMRAFVSTVNRFDISLSFGGIGVGDIQPVGTGDLNVELLLPDQTGWFDLAIPYGEPNGCQFTAPTYDALDDSTTVQAVFDGHTTIASDNRVYIRITLRTNAISVRDVESDWQ